MAATDMAEALDGGGVGFVQTPHDGQLMAVPGKGAALDTGALQSAMVNAQMEGAPQAGAAAQALEQQGFTVYQRPWGDWVSKLVRAVS